MIFNQKELNIFKTYTFVHLNLARVFSLKFAHRSRADLVCIRKKKSAPDQTSCFDNSKTMP